MDFSSLKNNNAMAWQKNLAKAMAIQEENNYNIKRNKNEK